MLRREPAGLIKQFAKDLHLLGRLIPKRLRRSVEAAPTTSSQVELPVAGSVEPAQPLILEIEGLSVTFGPTRALDGVTFAVAPGQVVGVIGANGAGKTTLIDAITGFVKPSAGTVTLGDRDVTRWSADRRARAGLSRSFQSLELFDSLSVRDNLLAACDSKSRVVFLTDPVRPQRQELTSTALAAVADFGLADVLDQRPDDLPYGTRRLVAIARAVATGPSILLLDEPAAGLDEAETRELATLIRQLAHAWKLGVIVVEHDMSLVLTTCDRIEVLDRGRHLATGTPEEIRGNPEVVDAYLGAKEPVSEENLEPTTVPATPAPRPVVSSPRASVPEDEPILQAVDLSAGYGDLAAVRGLNLSVHPGEVVALIGSNGAGKSTTLRTLAGQIPALDGDVRWEGAHWTAPMHERSRAGLAYVPEGRSVFVNLTVAANLRLGQGEVAEALEMFPELQRLMQRRGGLLSGGEQQILTLARALASHPTVLLADELSIGLAPKIVDRLFAAVRSAADEGLGAVVVDQSVERVLEVADRVVVLNRGVVALDERADALRGDSRAIFETYIAGPPVSNPPAVEPFRVPQDA
jgi:sulfate-transporting ATPase